MPELLEKAVIKLLPSFGIEPRRSTAPILAHGPVVLRGASPQAEAVLGGRAWRLERFPFTIGRSRNSVRRMSALQCDLYLPDRLPFNVSRRHCVIRWFPPLREFVLQDADSTLGSIVNGVRVGGPFGRDAAVLAPGVNEVVLGNPSSPFRFELEVPIRVTSSLPSVIPVAVPA